MELELEICEKPTTKKYTFSSDQPLSKKMTIPLYSSLLNRYCTSLVVAKQGSGKTSLVMNILSDKQGYKRVFDTILVFLPGTSLANIKNSPFAKLPEERIYDELNHETLSHAYRIVKENAEAGKKTLLILDDVSSEFKNKQIYGLLSRLVKNERHLHVSIIFIMQSYFDMPRQLRLLCNNLFLFSMAKNVMTTIFDELVELPKCTYDKLIEFGYSEPHSWLAFNMNRRNEVWKQYDRILFKEGEEE